MSHKPLVSGIVIFLNAEKFIEEAIQSVFAQTYNNWELLLVDDGSTDNSTAIAQRYAQKYPEKVSYLEHEGHQNRGMSATRNLGIKNAKGDYIAFLDADDIWLPQKLEKQLAIFSSQPEADVVCGLTKFWYSWTEKPQDIDRDLMREIAPDYDTLFDSPRLLTLLLQNQARTPATCSVLIRRTLFDVTGGFEESFQGMYEDQAFFAKVYLKAAVFVTSDCWDWYRQHSNNCCSMAEQAGKYTPGHLNPAHLTFLNWLSKYLSQQAIKDTELWDALQKILWSYKHPILYYLSRPKLLVRLISQRTLPVTVRHWFQI
ncbi:MAG: glycosyltransferase family 2 protein [Moorea sp. SIO2I5]|nr:glycosyltransferase family 2 protein [Moorena sp. SIO2I5]